MLFANYNAISIILLIFSTEFVMDDSFILPHEHINRMSMPIYSSLSRSKENVGAISNILREAYKLAKQKKSTEAISLVDSYLLSGERLDAYSCTIIIRVFGEANNLGRAISFLKTMKDKGTEVNIFHYGAVIQGCRNAGQWEIALELFHRLEDLSISRNVVIYNSIISTLGDVKKFDLMMNIYDKMKKEKVHEDVITFGSLISGCEKCGEYTKAVEIYNSMNLIPSTIVLNAILSATKSGRLFEKCIEIFHQAPARGIIRDVASYSITITAYSELGRFQDAYQLFQSMSSGRNTNTTSNTTTTGNQQDTKPYQYIRRDTGVYNAMITACSRINEWQLAYTLLKVGLAREQLLPDAKTYAAAITACSNANRWREALALFNDMDSARVAKDTVVFNAIISALQKAGRARLIREVLDETARASPTGLKRVSPTVDEVGISEPYLSSEYILSLARSIYSQGAAEGKLRDWGVTGKNPPISTSTSSNIFQTAAAAQNANNTIDFHTVPCSVAETAMSLILNDMYNGKRLTFDLYVITGRGNHMNSKGTRAIMRGELERYLITLQPENILVTESIPNNPGCVILRKETIDNWILVKKSMSGS